MLMIYLLEAFGYAPVTARDGLEGLEWLDSRAPDLILCDLQMPRVNGYEFSQQVKNRPELCKIPWSL
jgi:CheY-like chemotaxis protein